MRIKLERFWRRFEALLRREEYDRELAEELEFHRAMKQQEKENGGLDPKLAKESAQREMGNLTQAKENSREAWMFRSLETLGKDVRYAFRILLKSPVFTACAVFTLALGIGANAAIFTLIDAMLLRSLPVPQPDRIIQLTVKGEEQMTSLSYPLFEDVKERTRSFSGMFSWNSADLWTGWGAQARPMSGATVSGGAYQTLELNPQAGRLFRPSDDTSGAPFLVVISDGFWEREFHRDPRAIGRTLLLIGNHSRSLESRRLNFWESEQERVRTSPSRSMQTQRCTRNGISSTRRTVGICWFWRDSNRALLKRKPGPNSQPSRLLS